MDEFRPVPGFEGIYAINPQGDVKRVASEPNRFYGLLVKPRVRQDGYLEVQLRDASGKKRFLKVHRLVATVFLPRKRGRVQVDHGNANRTDPSVHNLEWTTKSVNQKRRSSKTRTIYAVICPNGEQYLVDNLSRFCTDRGLDRRKLYGVIQGYHPDLKGWKASYASS